MERMNLMYHGVHSDPGAAGCFDPVYSVTPDAFAAQLDWIAEQPDPARYVITFDDGDLSNATVALELLQARGLTATFFITSGFVGRAGMLTQAGVRTLHEAGMRIGAHGATHRFLEDLTPAELQEELAASKAMLEDLIGAEVDSMALPGGRGGPRELKAAWACGYRSLYGSVPGPDPDDDGEHACWRPRIAITRGMPLERFVSLATWSGLPARWMHTRFRLLALPKRVLGNAAYAQLRSRLT